MSNTAEQRSHRWPENSGKLILRVTVALLLLLHGIAKINNGVGGVESMLTSAGMPAFLALGVYVGEVIAPLLMVLGITCRLASLVVAFNMLVAIFLGHSGDLLSLNQYGGWAIELPVLYFVGALCVALLGPGDYVAWKGKGILE